MKRMMYLAILAVVVAGAASVQAAEVPALAKAKNCMTCHSIDKKLVGPAWKDIAAKYRGNATAEASLSAKITMGSSGVWGPVPMPPNAVTDAEASELAKFILSLP